MDHPTETPATHGRTIPTARRWIWPKPSGSYLKVGAVLIGVHLPHRGGRLCAVDQTSESTGLNITIGLLIATIKVSFVGLIFMHLNHERGLIYKVLFFTVIFGSAMMFLFVLAFLDPIKAALLN